MADICDIADKLIERSLQESIWLARQSKGLKQTGACHFCDEPIDSGLFCLPVDETGDGCARDYEAHQNAMRRAGTLR